MKKILIIISTINSKKLDLPNGSKIINGEIVQNPKQTYPWFVSIVPERRKTFPFCGASLINPYTAVTACHCFAEAPIKPSQMVVMHDAYDMKNLTQVKLGKFIKFKHRCHPEYDNESKINDIAIIHLNSKIDVDEYVKLDDSKVKDDLFHPARAIGFGKTDPEEEDFTPTNLRQVRLEIVSNPICKWHFQTFLNVTIQRKLNTCARKKYGGRGDTCQGDSGGPLIIDDCGHTLVGVTSFGVDCGLAYLAGIYTSVSEYLGFIRKNIKNNENDTFT